MTPKKIGKFHRLLLRWYRSNKRPLPWRKTRNPYHILVSEIMLQQTQVSRVLQKYPGFLRRFPTLHKLAHASTAEVVQAWRGMGYNNRAVRLRDFARQVVQSHEGKIPNDANTLQTLPGIGKYTAHALACFAFGKEVPVVDVNVSRVLSRIFFRMRHPADLKESKTMWRLAECILPKHRAADWNQALMDLGATYCTARKPLCAECPVSVACASRATLRFSDRERRENKKEKLYRGFPIRIYRGRIIEHLRNVPATIEVGKLGGFVKGNFSQKELPWLSSILHKLRNERLVELRARGDKTYARLART